MPGSPAPYTVRARNLVPDADNKIHDDDVAQQFGFAGALVPGVDLFAYLTHPLVAAWGENFLRGGRLSVRFRKPVYDGEAVTAEATEHGHDWAVRLVGPGGEVRAEGAAAARADDKPNLAGFVTTPLQPELLPTGPDRLPLGPMGSIEEPVDPDTHAAYLEGISDPLPLYRDGVLHPGAILRFVNAVLMRNVALGPWIHTGSDCRFLGLGRVPGTLRADAVVRDVFERKGNEWIRYETLVSCDNEPVAVVDHQAIYRLAGG